MKTAVVISKNEFISVPLTAACRKHSVNYHNRTVRDFRGRYYF